MRDPNRIKGIMALIEVAWMADPDIRLCQLIHNAVTAEFPHLHGQDLFHVDDEVLRRGVVKLLEEQR